MRPGRFGWSSWNLLAVRSELILGTETKLKPSEGEQWSHWGGRGNVVPWDWVGLSTGGIAFHIYYVRVSLFSSVLASKCYLYCCFTPEESEEWVEVPGLNGFIVSGALSHIISGPLAWVTLGSSFGGGCRKVVESADRLAFCPCSSHLFWLCDLCQVTWPLCAVVKMKILVPSSQCKSWRFKGMVCVKVLEQCLTDKFALRITAVLYLETKPFRNDFRR